jgi:hypothetical protein
MRPDFSTGGATMALKHRARNLSISIDEELRSFVEREAEKSDRSMAAQARVYLTQAMQAKQAEQQPRKSAA